MKKKLKGKGLILLKTPCEKYITNGKSNQKTQATNCITLIVKIRERLDAWILFFTLSWLSPNLYCLVAPAEGPCCSYLSGSSWWLWIKTIPINMHTIWPDISSYSMKLFFLVSVGCIKVTVKIMQYSCIAYITKPISVHHSNVIVCISVDLECWKMYDDRCSSMCLQKSLANRS